MTNIVFAGGGSGGHLFPGVAVAEELADRDPAIRCVFAGSARSIEKQILKPTRFEHVALSSSHSSNFLKSPFASTVSNWRAYRSARELLQELRPAVVIGLGGFASVPVVLAAWRWGVPVMLLEQNAVLGRANRVLLPFAVRICLSFRNTPLPFRYNNRSIVTGNPVRREILTRHAENLDQRTRPHGLLILGGSQGASAVNEAVLKALPGLRQELAGWEVVHQTGSGDFASISAEYARLGIPATVKPFLNDLGSIYPRTSLAISRAGGTSLAELAVHGVPSILIPYPRSIRDHQALNAEQFAHTGGAVVVPQSTKTVDHLLDHLRQLLTQGEVRATMGSALQPLASPNAARQVAGLVLECSLAKQRAA